MLGFELLRSLHRQRGVWGDADRNALGTCIEATRSLMPEEQAADDVAVPGNDWHRQVTANRQMPFRNPVVGRVAPVAMVSGDVGAADHTFAPERRGENGGGPREREVLERAARSPGQRVQLIGVPL